MSFSEDEYLMLSGIQHFVFCRRQWALIHIEQQWAENTRTIDGRILHDRVHDIHFRETRKDVVTVRALPVSSSVLGISGECDAVEFHRSEKGVFIPRLHGNYTVVPIEYKRGKPKEDLSDTMQLLLQALCLEEMLSVTIPYGYLYYGETKHRSKIVFTEELRSRAQENVAEMHQLFRRQHTPKAKRTKACNACSLKNICLPVLQKKKTVKAYINAMLDSEV